MSGKLIWRAGSKLLLGLAAVSLLLFWPAGTFHYWNAWLFILLLFVPMLVLGAVLLLKAPELLQKRLNANEKEPEQRRVVALSALMFVAGFIVAALDFRFGWSRLPQWVIIAAALLQLFSYGLYAEVMRENAYLSRVVEVQAHQKVIDTGLYGVVRHPMYAATILLCIAIPLVLGSVYAFLLFLSYPALIVKRIRNEEAVLEQGLEGYREYEQRVRYRMIPYFW